MWNVQVYGWVGGFIAVFNVFLLLQDGLIIFSHAILLTGRREGHIFEWDKFPLHMAYLWWSNSFYE